MGLGFRKTDSIRICTFVLLSATLFSGCLENKGTNAPSAASAAAAAASKFGSGTPGGDLPSSSTSSFISVQKVLRSNLDPNSLIELIGSNGEIGNYCATVNDCECVFNWVESNGILREVSTQTAARVETDLMRCTFTQITSDASYFDVKIRIKSGDLYSNTTRVQLTAVNPSFDTRIGSNYVPVYRYMCKDIITKQNNTNTYLNNSLLDPRLWDLSNTYNLYTSSLGQDYGATPIGTNTAGVTGYECPTIPNDPSDPVYDYTLYSVSPVDISNPSLTNVASGDNTIYPVTDNLNLPSAKCLTGDEATCEKYAINRHDFLLATFQNSIFKEPVCLIHRVANFNSQTLNCTIDSSRGPVQLGNASVTNGGGDIIGFGALPDVNENCPSSDALPAGKKWAKLWKFRASIDKRTIMDVANPDDINNLFCTYRNKECLTVGELNGARRYSVCWDATPVSGGGIGYQQSGQLFNSPTAPGWGNCDDFQSLGDNLGPGGAFNPTNTYATPTDGTSACQGGLGTSANNVNCCHDLGADSFVTPADARAANYRPGGRWCNPALKGQFDAKVDGGLAQDVWLVGNGNRRACIEADTNSLGALKNTAFPPGVVNNPFIWSSKEIDAESRYDIVYVVSPPAVKIAEMEDLQNNPIAKQYTPKRVAPGGGGTMLQYKIDSDSFNTGTASQRLAKFPLCVIQDAKKGDRQYGVTP